MNKKNAPKKRVRSFRIDAALLEKAKFQGADVTKIFEAALARALKDQSCPYCGK